MGIIGIKLEETSETERLFKAYNRYRECRIAFLKELKKPKSNRDPITELSESIVASLAGGKLAENTVQKGWDVELPDGKKIQVKSLSNPSKGSWPNPHLFNRKQKADYYAIVLFLGLLPAYVHIVPMEQFDELCRRVEQTIDKEGNLGFARNCHDRLVKYSEEFEEIGIQLHKLTIFEPLGP